MCLGNVSKYIAANIMTAKIAYIVSMFNVLGNSETSSIFFGYFLHCPVKP